MPVIWGLDLKELQWGKFKSSYMFGNKDFYLRRTKFVVYQLAMIFCVTSESLGTAALSDFLDSQTYIRENSANGVEHNNDYVGMASYNIFAGVFVAFIFGSAFFFDLFWPARKEDRGIRLAWKGTSVAACIFMLASIIVEVIIVSTRAAYVTGVTPEEAQVLLDRYGGYPLAYNKNGRAIASCVFAWLGFPFVVISTVVMWKSINYTELYGPYSKTAKLAMMQKEGQTSPLSEDEKNLSSGMTSNHKPSDSEGKVLDQPAPPAAAHTRGPVQSPAGDVSTTYPGT